MNFFILGLFVKDSSFVEAAFISKYGKQIRKYFVIEGKVQRREENDLLDLTVGKKSMQQAYFWVYKVMN